jgi:hypothetical protein
MFTRQQSRLRSGIMGKLTMECILETKAATILEFIRGLNGSLSVTFEEGTSAAWLHDLLKPHVSHLIVCDPRKNALLKDGSLCTAQRKLPNALRIVRESYGGQTLQGVTLTCFCSA